jgi:hypothetical protein
MGTQYYAGKWNDHDIVFILGDEALEIRFDGKVIAEKKITILFSATMTAAIPLEPELTVFAHFEDHVCSCIVGKALETDYDKETKTFSAVYNGHKIEGNNKKLKGALLVDGVEVDKEDSGLRSFCILGTQADDNGKRTMAVFEAAGLKTTCQFYAEAENVRMYACQKQGGELIPLDRNGDDDFMLGFVLGMGVH